MKESILRKQTERKPLLVHTFKELRLPLNISHEILLLIS
jgi:hypothetical protein